MNDAARLNMRTVYPPFLQIAMPLICLLSKIAQTFNLAPAIFKLSNQRIGAAEPGAA
jgi:hypothetical protein